MADLDISKGKNIHNLKMLNNFENLNIFSNFDHLNILGNLTIFFFHLSKCHSILESKASLQTIHVTHGLANLTSHNPYLTKYIPY